MGIACTTTCVLIFGSPFYSGFNLPELWARQGTCHLTYLLGHLNKADNVGTLIRITMDTLQLHLLGFPNTPLSHPYSMIQRCIDPTWLTTTWDFMTESKATLILADPWILPL